MKFLLDGEDVWELVSDDEGFPESDEDRRRCKKAAYLIYQSCTSHPQSYIAHETDPAKMWTILEKLYSRTNDDETGQTLFEEFWTEQFQWYNSIEEYGAKLKDYQDQLADISERRLTDSNLIYQLVKGLPPQYDDIATSIRLNKSKVDFHLALGQLIERERILGDRRQSKALVANTTNASTGNGTGNSNDSSNSTDDTNSSHRDYTQHNHCCQHYRHNHRCQHHGHNHHSKPYDRSCCGNHCGNHSPCNNPSSSYYDPAKRCTYCTRKGHSRGACRLRIRAEQMNNKGPQACATTAHANIAHGQHVDDKITDTAAPGSLAGRASFMNEEEMDGYSS